MYRNGFFEIRSIDQNNKAKLLSVSPLRKMQEMQFGNLPVFVSFSMKSYSFKPKATVSLR